MSGHSHFRTIMHKKGAADAKRSQAFSKLAKELTVAAKEGGTDPITNPRLRTVMEKAREANMPSDNVERAIKKAAGQDAGKLQEMLLEAYGPGGIALLIAVITDNRNRTLGGIKQILSRHQGKMVEGGAVQWLFERKGVATIEQPESSKEELELLAIEAGAEDLDWDNHTLYLYANPSELATLKDKLREKNVQATTSLDWVAKEHVRVATEEQKAAEQLLGALDDHGDVQGIYSNL